MSSSTDDPAPVVMGPIGRNRVTRRLLARLPREECSRITTSVRSSCRDANIRYATAPQRVRAFNRGACGLVTREGRPRIWDFVSRQSASPPAPAQYDTRIHRGTRLQVAIGAETGLTPHRYGRSRCAG